jgi:signal transduction histidine kinase
VGAIQKNVRDLGRGRYEAIVPANENVRQELVRRAEQLQPAPPNFQQGLQREAEHIGRIAEAEYDRVKTRWEKQFLETLRAKRRGHQITNLSDIQRVTDDLLTFVRDFCRCSYLVFFASLKEGETVLVPIAQAGVAVAWLEMLPHFNWRKAALSLESAQIDQVSLLKESKGLLKGIRGHHVDLFNDAACIVPMTMDNPYRSVLIFGPFAEPVELDREGTFLAQITRIIGVYVVNQLQILQLQAERKAWEDRTKLLTHHVRTALTPITTYVSAAKLYGQKLAIDPTMLTRLQDAILRAHAMCLRLGQSVRDTVSAHVILVEEDDLHFERFPLSVLVMNAAQGFAEVIQERQRELVIHPSVEQLPTATIDVARMSIALSNLIENALKYSFPNTKITIRASVYDFAAPGIDFAHAYVEIHDDGDGIPEEQRLRIFDSGVRGLAEAKLRRVPGTGLGLWEARAVLEAHGGAITVQSDPTGLKQRQGDVYHVTFRVKIPLSQPEKSRGTPA